MPTITPEALREFVVSLFQTAGASATEARIVGGHLVEASFAGVDSHGVRRVPQYIKAMQSGEVKLNVLPKILSEAPTTATVDGVRGFGQVACAAAMSLAVSKALENGIAAVAVRNCYHCGRLASYSKMATAHGLIGIVMVNAGGGGQSVSPFGGLARRLATNPLSIAAPSANGDAIVLDIATSVAPEGRVRRHYEIGKPIPADWIIDAQGRPTTDPKEFCETGGGALLPLGGTAGYKGFGLAFMIDILAGALSGAGCCHAEAIEPRDGVLIITLDIQRFLPLNAYYRQVSLLVEHVKSCPPVPGYPEVLVPGEIEVREERKRHKGILVDEAIWRSIKEVAATVGVATAWADDLETLRGGPSGSQVNK